MAHDVGRRGALALVASIALALALAPTQPSWLGTPEFVADGIQFFHSTDQSLVEPAGPVAVFLLRLDASRVRLESALAHDEIMGPEPVAGIAARHDAVAAVNGGFFNTRNGEPVSVLKVAGELVSDNLVTKGAVVIRSPPRGKTELDFDQISARVAVDFKAAGHEWQIPVDGVDTTRERDKLMLYTPKYHADTDTAPNGTEWVLTGRPLRVQEVRSNQGHTPIPADGAVLSYGGAAVPAGLAALAPAQRVTLETMWKTVNGLSPKRLESADSIVNGAGLLRRKGHVLANWQDAESLNPQTFINMRHPRTLVGLDRRGFIWLAAIDGRQPGHSVGMMFADLERLCDRLDLTDALNLDGGGSTTMVVKGRVVNKPSDAAGPRAVGDAILVTARRH
jgi:hypothetical protein